ncbi:MAG: hypothetical protein ACKVQK_05435 [Burkholderiales bacterium]
MYADLQTSGRQMSKTKLNGQSNSDSNSATGLPVLVFAFLAGTGGYATADYLAKRSDHGYRFIQFQGAEKAIEICAEEDIVRTPAENLARIRDVLKPTITELANLFGVSRQAVYDWQAGKQTATENSAKLDALAKAADVLALSGIQGSSQLLRRRFAGGESLIGVIREGGSVVSAAQALAQILGREAKQREQLATRLAGRVKPSVPQYEYGVPMLDERS